MAKENGKVTVSKEVAQMLDELRSMPDFQPELLVEEHAVVGKGYFGVRKPLNGLPLDTLIRALYIGYEIEKSPEEEFLDSYRTHLDITKFYDKRSGLDRCEFEQERFSSGYVAGAKRIAQAHGIKLPERTDAN